MKHLKLYLPIAMICLTVPCLATDSPTDTSGAGVASRPATKPSTSQSSSGSIRIDANFPGGNILVDRIDGDRVTLRPDLRDTTTWWFYWHFRVRGAAGRTIAFEFTGPNPIGTRGPAVTADGGRTWAWLGTKSVSKATFTYTFPKQTDDVRFAFTIPYLEADLRAFLQSFRNDPHQKIEPLCTTAGNRNVEALHFGRLDGNPDYRVLLTARHHACETMASFVLEGIIQSVLRDDDQKWLRDHVEFLAVPFVDKDGVEQGDQGKNRSPHDHNRDYIGTSIYPAVAALRNRVPQWSDGRLRIALDLHCPHIRGDRNENIYFVGKKEEHIWRESQQLAAILESLPPKGLPYNTKNNLPFGKEWNTEANLKGGRAMAGWACEIPGIKAAATIEIPYANASGSEVSPDSARAFGRDLAQAIRRYLSH